MTIDVNSQEFKDAVQAAVDAATEGLAAKNRELLGEVKKLKRGAEIDPAEVVALESQIDTLKADLTKAQKEAKAFAKQAEDNAKALEQESGAARSYALEAEITDAIAKGNVVPALVPALKAMVAQQAKADLVDGKYAVMIGDKPARDYICTFLDSDDGKHFVSANQNSGGGAGGGSGAGGAGSVKGKIDGSESERAAYFASKYDFSQA